MTRLPKRLKAHETRWQVVINRGDRFGVKHYDTKAEADAVAGALNVAHGKVVAFVNPPRRARGGKDAK